MTTKELISYVEKMDAKFQVKRDNKKVGEIRNILIKNPNKKLLELVEALKGDIDLRLFRCYNSRFYMYEYNWFDVYIPKYKLGIKICKSKMEKDTAFQLYKRMPIVMFDMSQDITLDDMLTEIIQKIAKIGEGEEKK